MKKVAIIVAGGKGIRMNAKIPKQFLMLNQSPILMHTLKKFDHFKKIILVLPESQINYWKNLCKKHEFTIPHTIIIGGKTRFQSVQNALMKIDNESVVAIHDGVRPLVSKKLIDKLISKAKNGVGTIPVILIKDSVRKIKSDGISSFVNRTDLYKVQTPQCFISKEIKNAYSQKFKQEFTDDSVVFESNGGEINALIGEEKNIKITTKNDLKIAKSL